MKRKLEDLDLLDDFLLGSMVTYPGIGEEFSRKLLEIIFQKTFGSLTVVPQKIYYGSDTNQHGVRLDVYLEENTTSNSVSKTASDHVTIYDIEADKNDDSASLSALPRRVRFYHAKIDNQSLKSGKSYQELKNVIIIMITSYDPFEQDRMLYTLQTKCVELPSMPYDDGAKTLFLYVKGTKGNPPEYLKQLLHYMDKTNPENATNKELKRIQQMVDLVKSDKEVSLGYMKIFEREEMLKAQGRREGKIEGEISGETKKLIQLVYKKMKKGMNSAIIADALEEDEVYIQKIMNIINLQDYEYDEELIYQELCKETTLEES